MVEELSRDEKGALTAAVLRVLNAWSVPLEAQLGLLGLDPGLGNRELRRFRLGAPLPEGSDRYQRVALLLRIDNSLHTLFPHSELSANLWVTTPRRKLGNLTPLDLMLQKGRDGMRDLALSLDNLDLW